MTRAADAPADDTMAAANLMDLNFPQGRLQVAPLAEGGDYGDFWRRMQSGAWEPETLWVMSRLLRQGSTFYDIGAWIGPTALFAALLGARVVAFEPDPVARAALSANLALNPALPIEVRPYALAHQASTASLYSDALGNSESSLLSASSRRGGVVRFEPRAHIECRAFAEELAALPADSVVKIDVEGGEFDVFRGAPPPSAATWLVSTHPRNLVSTTENSRALRVEKLNRLLDSFAAYHWHRLTRWGLLSLDQTAFRAHCERYPDRLDELVFSRAPLDFAQSKASRNGAVLWASNAGYQPARWLGEAAMSLGGFQRVSPLTRA
jgi:FkbM family methyltransferase